MSELILHHHGGSPFSEKVRLMLGFNALDWRSVKVPVIMTVIQVAEIVAPHAALRRWFARMQAFGHGSAQAMPSDEAIAIAAAANGHAPSLVQAGLGFEPAQDVTVTTATATDHGLDPAAGTLMVLGDAEVLIRRSDEPAGTLHVHFPRTGFQIKADKS